MPTKNRRIATYLPDEIDTALQNFKRNRSIEGDSQALITILSEFLGVSQRVAHTVDYSSKYVTIEQFNELTSELRSERQTSAVSELSGELLSKLQSLESRIEALEKDFQNKHSGMSQSELLSESSGDRDVPDQLELLNNKSKQEHFEALPKVDRDNGNLSGGLSARQLEERFKGKKGANRKAIGRQKDLPDFSEWSAQQDPDGIAWEHRDGKFYQLQSATGSLPSDSLI